MLAEPLPYEVTQGREFGNCWLSTIKLADILVANGLQKVCTEWDCVAFLLSLALGPEAKCSSQEHFMEGVADSVR